MLRSVTITEHFRITTITTKTNQMKIAVIKANRKGSREAELENKTGWTSKHTVVASAKTYKRKPKHKLQP